MLYHVANFNGRICLIEIHEFTLTFGTECKKMSVQRLAFWFNWTSDIKCTTGPKTIDRF